MSAKKECPREKKRTRIRQELYRMSDREFRRRCADHIRAIRYLRLRNQELQFLNSFLRIQRLVAERSVRHVSKADIHIIGNINGKMEPKDWEHRYNKDSYFLSTRRLSNGANVPDYTTFLHDIFKLSALLWNTQDKPIFKNTKGIFRLMQSSSTIYVTTTQYLGRSSKLLTTGLLNLGHILKYSVINYGTIILFIF